MTVVPLLDKRPLAIYINLAHRTDRRTEIETTLRSLDGCFSSVRRLEATWKPECGALGCAASHCRALADFLFSSDSDSAVIFEDDFELLVEVDVFKKMIVHLVEHLDAYDCVCFAYNQPVLVGGQRPDKLIRVLSSLSSSCYFVTRPFAHELLRCFAESHAILKRFERVQPKNALVAHAAIDVMWKRLQLSSRWFVTERRYGRQRPSFSDIEQRFVEYDV